VPVTTVIPSYNDAEFLAGALEAVAGQTVRPSQVLVVDDGSDTRAAADIVERMRGSLGLPLAYVRRPNGGASAARNTGIELADQPLVAFLDADDRWLPEHLERKVDRLLGLDERYASVYDGYVNRNPDGRSLWTPPTRAHDGPASGDKLWGGKAIPVVIGCHLYRRAALQAVAGFDEAIKMGEDFDITLRLTRAGYLVRGTAVPTMVRQIRRGSLTTSDMSRTLTECDRWFAKAQRERLMEPRDLRALRRSIWLVIAHELIAAGDHAAAARLADEAWAIGRPQGAGQWLLYLSARSGGSGTSRALLQLAGGMRRLRRRTTDVLARRPRVH
jgi:glycosyltransferase involved in cell wall biosynthesis